MTPGQICTVALGRVGEKQAVDNLSANTTAAKLCNAIYELARDSALEEHPWPFATRRATLGVLADDEDDDEARANTAWQYVYALPTDILPGGVGCRYLETGLPNPAPDQQIPFVLEDDADEGLVLLTNQNDAELVYTRKVTETGKFSPLFTDALAWRIAYELCFALPVKPGTAERMWQAYQAKVSQAAASTMKHQLPGLPPKPKSVRVRY